MHATWKKPQASEAFARAWSLRWRIAGGAALVVAASYLGFLQLAGPKVEAARVVRRDVVQSVVASGRVETPHRVDVGA